MMAFDAVPMALSGAICGIVGMAVARFGRKMDRQPEERIVEPPDTVVELVSEISLLKGRVLQLERRVQDSRPANEPLVGAALRRAIANMEVKDELGLPRMEWNQTQ